VESTGKVVRLLDDGIVVDLGDDVEGFVPRSHLEVPSGDDLLEYLHDGMELPLRVIEFDAANRRIVLTVTRKLEKLPEELRARAVPVETSAEGAPESGEVAVQAEPAAEPAVAEPAAAEPAAAEPEQTAPAEEPA
jgi:small subunit ribosomal protein S1